MGKTPIRAIHFVGTYPADTDKQAMQDMLKQAGPYLRSLPSGETRRPNWIIEDLKLLEKHPDVIVTKKGDYKTYDRMAQMKVKDNGALDYNDIVLTYHQYTHENWPIFADLRKKYHRPELSMQINLPGTVQVPMFAFGQKNPLLGYKYREPFSEAMQREVDKIWHDPIISSQSDQKKNDQLVWQIEIPAEVGGMAKAPIPGFMKPLAAAFFAKSITDQVSLLPENAHVILHLCNGDLNRQGFTHPKSAQLITTLTNAILKKWPEGRTLDAIHFPLASGDQPPSLDAAYYHPLKNLKLDDFPNTRFIAGFVHESPAFEDQLKVLGIIEDTLGTTVDIAGSCGLGRCSRAVAKEITRRSIALAKA